MNLNFKFKGERNYVHGTDIYSMVNEKLKQEFDSVESLELSFHKIAKKQLEMNVFEYGNDLLDYSNQTCIFKFSSHGKKYVVGLEETTESIQERYDYDESEMEQMANVDIEQKLISLTPSGKYSNIELVVGMNKILLNQILPDPGKWYFARLQLVEDINPIKASKIQIRLIKNIGSKITKSNISINENILGNMFFSKVQQH